MNKRTLIVIGAVIALLLIIWLIVAYRGSSNNNNDNNNTVNENTSQNTDETVNSSVNDNVLAYMSEQDNIMGNMMDNMMNVEKSGSGDISFLAGMIPHHESAIDMAESYIKHGAKDEKMKAMAENIITAQSEEINQMNDLISKIKESNVTDNENEEAYLQEYNNLMMESHLNISRNYENVDTAFAEGMIEHHQMAVNMSNIILKYSNNEEVRKLAENIVMTQEKEIRDMSDFLNR